MEEFFNDLVLEESLKDNKISNFLTNQIFNSVQAFVFIFDFEKTIPVWINKYFEIRMGYSEGDLMNITGDQFMVLFHPNSLKVLIHRISNYSNLPSSEKNRVYRLVTKDRKWINLMINSTILKWTPEGKIKYLIGYGIEVLENELQKSLYDLNQFELKSANTRLIEKLSNRELEIITNIANCLTDKEIAEKLKISVNTAKTHRKRIINKLGLKNTASLVKFAIESGLV